MQIRQPGEELEQLWATTPAELERLAAGYKLRDERERRLLAWVAANLMNVHLKRKVKLDDLLRTRRQPKAQAEKTASFEKLWARVAAQRRAGR